MPSLEKINNTDNGRVRILIAPLDWGMGHTTRCLPIIKAFQSCGAHVSVACSQNHARLLESEIPGIGIFQIRGYELRYSKSKWGTRLAILFQIPKILIAIKRESNWLNSLLRAEKFDVVISDNRYGFHHSSAYSIFITHQLRVRIPSSQWLERLLQKWNYRFIQKFDECWIPDVESDANLAGALSHPKQLPAVKAKYIGTVSRFKRKSEAIIHTNKLAVLISGPEPQRTIFENIIISELMTWKGEVVVLRGMPGATKMIPSYNNISFYNHLPAQELNEILISAEYVIARAGYSTVMDVVSLQKKSILIPTPGQTEQEYLGLWLMKKKYCLSVDQKKFSLTDAIKQAENFEYGDLSEFATNGYEKAVSDFMQQHFKETIEQDVSTKI